MIPLVHAQENVLDPLAKVEAASLQYIGRPIQDRDSGDIIALVCLESCVQLRFVYFRNAQSDAYFYGPVLTVKHSDKEPSRREIKATLKQFKKQYRNYIGRRDHVLEKRYGALLAFILAGAVVIKNVPLPPQAELVFVGAVFVGGLFIYIAQDQPLLGRSGTISRALADQSGWNWSNRIRSMKSKHFQSLRQCSDQGNTLSLLP